MEPHTGLEQQVEAIVRNAVLRSPENRLRGFDDEPAWGEPVVGFAAGDDPLFEFFRKDIGEFYWTPDGIFALSLTGQPLPSAHGLTVISWVIPQTETTKRDQRQETRYASKRWIHSRAYWSEFTRSVHSTVVDALAEMGIRSVAPEMSEHWRSDTSERYGFASRWSQRHTAYVAGLGAFGLSGGLITPVGMAMRAGSVVAECTIAPTSRQCEHYQAWCPFFVDGTCGECIDRCPAGAITKDGNDKVKCEAYLSTVVGEYAEPIVGRRETGCGLCQAGVQCESGIPESIRR